MPTNRRRVEARRRAWGRGPMILRFEPLEDRKLLSTALPDLVSSAFDTAHNLDWGDSFHAVGVVANRGTAAVTSPFRVNIYASPNPALSNNSVLLGQVTVPAGLQPGGQAPFDQTVNLPANGLKGVDPSGSVYVGVYVDPDNLIAESNKLNNAGTGQGYDTSLVTITRRLPSNLTGAGLGVYPDQTQWGQTIQVNARVENQAAGDAPATRARLVLTPVGTNPGGPADVTVGNLDVPAVAAWQGVAVTGTVTLPSVPPSTLIGASQFVLSVTQDADFAADKMSPHLPTKGLGLDMTRLTVAAPTNPNIGLYAPRPNLTVTKVQAPTLPIALARPSRSTRPCRTPATWRAGLTRFGSSWSGRVAPSTTPSSSPTRPCPASPPGPPTTSCRPCNSPASSPTASP